MDLSNKLAVAAVLTLAFGSAAVAQDDDLKIKLEKKLKSEFIQKAGWFTDYDKAREEAKKTGKAIFGYFTRSYSP